MAAIAFPLGLPRLADKFLTNGFFPRMASDVPFGEMLESIFFDPALTNMDYPVHGPNVIRFVEALLDLGSADGLFKGSANELHKIYASRYPLIMSCLEVDLQKPEDTAKTKDVLMIAALYHDIGKAIRKANHPQIGANIVRNFDARAQDILVGHLSYPNDRSSNSRNNRFALISSVIQHHDKFRVVSTGEGGLPIFSDILYFTSDQASIGGVKKNVTSVMLVNLADIAAVNTSPDKQIGLKIAARVLASRKTGATYADEMPILDELKVEMCRQESCLGLRRAKLQNVLDDWEAVIHAISHHTVNGNRVALKLHLLELERNPARAIQRVYRLLQEACLTSKVAVSDLINQTTVESALVGTLGAHQFQMFCEQFATVVKLDYSLNFFKAIVCATARKGLCGVSATASWGQLSDSEAQALAALTIDDRAAIANAITILFVKVLETLVSRYSGVLDQSSSNPRRFGFQMRNLTEDQRVRDAIIDFLCIRQHRDPIALTWMADEVTIWSMD